MPVSLVWRWGRGGARAVASQPLLPEQHRPQLLTTNTTTQPCRDCVSILTHSSTRACACRADSVTSVVIPLAMAGTTGLLWARGMLNLYLGTGKLEDQ